MLGELRGRVARDFSDLPIPADRSFAGFALEARLAVFRGLGAMELFFLLL